MTCLAQAVLRQGSLPEKEGWTARRLALAAHGLARGEGEAIQGALGCLAQEVLGRPLDEDPPWSAQHLAMLTHGLARCERKPAGEALTRLARTFSQRELTAEQGWSALHLALVAHGLSAARCGDVQRALTHLAQHVRACSTGELQGWTVRQLVMTAHGLSRGMGPEVAQAMEHLALCVQSVGLTPDRGWTPPLWVMMTDAMGQALYDHALFGRLVSALAGSAAREPGLLASALGALCSCALRRPHLDAAWQWLDALRAEAIVPRGLRVQGQLLWGTTLLHFASRLPELAEEALAERFAAAYRAYSGGGSDEPAAGRDTRLRDSWHIRWARDYWASFTGEKRTPVVMESTGCPEVSALQGGIFHRLREALPGHELEMETRINDFPVDILIDRQVCVEVDGPSHFIHMAAPAGRQPGDARLQRRTKDLFIDHMLRGYGFAVFRIVDGQDPDSLGKSIRQIRAVLEHRRRGVRPDSRS